MFLCKQKRYSNYNNKRDINQCLNLKRYIYTLVVIVAVVGSTYVLVACSILSKAHCLPGRPHGATVGQALPKTAQSTIQSELLAHKQSINLNANFVQQIKNEKYKCKSRLLLNLFVDTLATHFCEHRTDLIKYLPIVKHSSGI